VGAYDGSREGMEVGMYDGRAVGGRFEGSSEEGALVGGETIGSIVVEVDDVVGGDRATLGVIVGFTTGL